VNMDVLEGHVGSLLRVEVCRFVIRCGYIGILQRW
jgi:hypothetical protein